MDANPNVDMDHIAMVYAMNGYTIVRCDGVYQFLFPDDESDVPENIRASNNLLKQESSRREMQPIQYRGYRDILDRKIKDGSGIALPMSCIIRRLQTDTGLLSIQNRTRYHIDPTVEIDLEDR